MTDALQTQYNNFADKYARLAAQADVESSRLFLSYLDVDIANKKVLDLGCGDSRDIEALRKKGAICSGIDTSSQGIVIARQRFPKLNLEVASMIEIPYKDNLFDIVISKYAMQSCSDVSRVISEAQRVLKPGGIFLYLSKHPIRQFKEKIRSGSGNYFRQEIVKSKIFNGEITLHEPTHTTNEYLCKEFFDKFEFLSFEEFTDFPASEQLDKTIYPTFFIIKAKKK